MIFNSVEFLVFLPVVWLGYRTLRTVRPQNGFLLVASYVFYGAWDWRFLGLIVLSTLVDFSVARRLARVEVESRRRALLAASLVVNLGILGTFKYFGFFVDSAVRMLSTVGLEPNPPLFEVLVPVGISFYTFQTISYTFDVFRRRIRPASDLLTFATYVAYFPQLVAGPIERARNLLPQLERPRAATDAATNWSGLCLIVLGLFKKVAIADVIAPVADRAFDGPAAASTMTLAVGVVAFSLQIYGDFSGYTDIARGTSRLLGVELQHNFRQPYLSRSITEFWRTWHISLSDWLRDYLYVPLGGNRRGRRRTYVNLMATMLLGGLWHGASWNFVLWGGLHGALLAGHRWLRDGRAGSGGSLPTLREVPAVLLTIAVVALAWIPFRAQTLGDTVAYFEGLLTLRGGLAPAANLLLLAYATAAVLCIDLIQRSQLVVRVRVGIRPVLEGAAAAVLVAGVLLWSGGPVEPFIYFQF